MKALDDLLIQRNKLKELVRYAQIYGGKVSIEDEIITIAELKGMLTEVKIQIESNRSKLVLRRVK